MRAEEASCDRRDRVEEVGVPVLPNNDSSCPGRKKGREERHNVGDGENGIGEKGGQESGSVKRWRFKGGVRQRNAAQAGGGKHRKD